MEKRKPCDTKYRKSDREFQESEGCLLANLDGQNSRGVDTSGIIYQWKFKDYHVATMPSVHGCPHSRVHSLCIHVRHLKLLRMLSISILRGGN